MFERFLLINRIIFSLRAVFIFGFGIFLLYMSLWVGAVGASKFLNSDVKLRHLAILDDSGFMEWIWQFYDFIYIILTDLNLVNSPTLIGIATPFVFGFLTVLMFGTFIFLINELGLRLTLFFSKREKTVILQENLNKLEKMLEDKNSKKDKRV